MGSFLGEAMRLYAAERRLKRGDMTPEEFTLLVSALSRGSDAFKFFRATILVVLHIPLVEVPYLLGLVLFVPILTALLVVVNGLATAFWIYVITRSLVGLQDAWLMIYAHRIGSVPFTSSLTGTIVGTLPYRYNYLIGPLAWTGVEVGLYLIIFLLPGLFVQVEQLFPGVLPALSTLGVLQVLIHTFIRVPVNVLILWEIPRLADPETFHRVRLHLWRWRNRLTGRGDGEVEKAEAHWRTLRDDLNGPAWRQLDQTLDDLPAPSKERIKRYLLASRKDEMILLTLLDKKQKGASGM